MRRFSVFGLIAALVLPLPAAAQGGSAATLLALHRQFVGWTLGGHSFATMRIQGQVTDHAGAVVGRWTTLEMGALYRTDGYGYAGGDYGFTGRVFWDSDMNGFTRPNFSSRQAFLISRYVLFNEGTSELTGTLQAPQSVDGTSYDVVRVQPPSGVPIDLYVDPATGAYGRAILDPGGSYQVTYDILSYQNIGSGKRYISQYRVDGSSMTDAFTSVQGNVPVSTTELHPPLPTATWSFTSTQSAPIRMTPFAMFVNARVNGVQGTFLIDTGSSEIILTRDFAARAHVAMGVRSAVQGIGGSLNTQMGRIDSLTIGGAQLRDALVEVGGADQTLNASNLNEAQGTITVNGYLGFPIFADSVVNLNTSNQTITVEDPSTTTVDRSYGYNALVDLSSGQPMVPMVIDARTTVNAILDTGNGAFVDMSQEAVDLHHLPILAGQGTLSAAGMPFIGVNSNMDPDAGVQIEDYLRTHQVVRGVGGAEVQRCSTITSIALGPITYQSTYACVSPSMTGDQIFMGYAFLRNFDYIFDYPEGLLILRPHAQ